VHDHLTERSSGPLDRLSGHDIINLAGSDALDGVDALLARLSTREIIDVYRCALPCVAAPVARVLLALVGRELSRREHTC
jgi:hypothetical protein